MNLGKHHMRHGYSVSLVSWIHMLRETSLEQMGQAEVYTNTKLRYVSGQMAKLVNKWWQSCCDTLDQ